MSATQSHNDDSSESGGGGCLLTILAIVLLFVGLLGMGGGDSTSTTTRSGALSGNQAELFSRNQNELLSRNTLALWSEVYNCWALGSCVFVTEMVTNTTTTVTSVEGERNVIYAANGAMMCQNPDNPNEWGDRADWCRAAGVMP